MQTPTIYVKKVPIEKDGRKFNAWETYDTKDKTKMSVSFTQDGDKEPENSCRITALDWWIDRRQKYPRMRIREYAVCEQDEDISEEKNQRDYDEFFASETPTKTSKK
jgi:hypothetical protein|nr:MAG TPA: hypothetical protein [Caudoviricetes sp.]